MSFHNYAFAQYSLFLPMLFLCTGLFSFNTLILFMTFGFDMFEFRFVVIYYFGFVLLIFLQLICLHAVI